MDEILKVALQQGLGYALFVFLLFYVLREQAKRDEKAESREKNYQDNPAMFQDFVNDRLKSLAVYGATNPMIKIKLANDSKYWGQQLGNIKKNRTGMRSTEEYGGNIVDVFYGNSTSGDPELDKIIQGLSINSLQSVH